MSERINLPENAKVMAIGGGGAAKSARPMLEEGLELTGKQKPSVLLIPTPKNRPEAHDKSVKSARKMYAKQLGLPFEVLHGKTDGSEEMPDYSELQEKMQGADFIYISGGNTEHAVDVWKRHHIDTLLEQALADDTVATGISAGAVAWFSQVHTDSSKYNVPKPADEVTSEDWDWAFTDGLGKIDAIVCPHYSDEHPDKGVRSEDFKRRLEADQEGFAGESIFGIDSNAGLLVVDGMYRVIRSEANANLHVVRFEDEVAAAQTVTQEEFAPVSELFDR